MCLVDDLMEPFRPVVDLRVHGLSQSGVKEVTPEAKAALAAVASFDMVGDKGVTPLSTALERLASSIAQAFETGDAKASLPKPGLPLDLATPQSS